MERDEITGKVVGCFYEVYNVLGHGFLEKVYSNALACEFERAGLNFVKEFPINVSYKGDSVGDYFADFLVEGEVVVEVKSMIGVGNVHNAQVLNYLKATGKDVGLILNLGKSAEVKRVIFESARKK